jgi:hypothetical protein
MTTDELILQLAKSARPVAPLPPPSARALRWLLMAAMAAAVAVIAIGPRTNLDAAVTQPAFAASLLALIIAMVSAAVAAMAMSVPGAERSTRLRVLPIAAVAAWVATWLLRLATSPARHPRLFHVGCAVEIAVLGVVLGWTLVAMLRRAAPLQPAWTAAIAAIAAVTVASAATQVICPIDDPAHQLVGHVLVAAAVGLGAFVAGRGRLARRRLATRRS